LKVASSPAFAVSLIILLTAGAGAGPSRFGFSDRVERHLFPEVTTGPAEPAWSPDGADLAFSMQGDIWRVGAAGGEAVALTKGPWYYFEPVWSPDGQWIAFTVDTGGNLDIGVVRADGTGLLRLTEDEAVDIEPAWSPDGQDLYFVSSRSRGFDIFRLHLADRTVTPVVTGPGDQIQPAVSPDGRTLGYVSPVRGRLGTGGIWTRPLTDAAAEPALVHYEESEYRMRPQWTPDGRAFVFGSDEMGSNDVAIVPADGGNAVVITNDPMGEFSPAVSPDGRTLAFISNRAGPMTLYTSSIAGGPMSSWNAVRITTRRAQTPTGRLRVAVTGAGGRPMPARVHLFAADGRAYAPDDGFARVIAVSETHYFHTEGTLEVTVPAGQTRIEVLRGFEYVPIRTTLEVQAGQTVTGEVRLERPSGLREALSGWYSGDTHAHDLHQGRFGLMHRSLFTQSLAEDLNVSNVLIHMDGTRLMGRWADLTGEPHPLSTPTHILQFAQEFRGSLGHIGLLGISRFVLPLVGGTGNTAYEQTASDLKYIDAAREQGGIAGFMHPYLNAGRNPAGWSGSLIPVDVALGRGDFYDVASLYSDELASAEMYYKLLNCGFRLPATGGTDNFPDVWRDPPPGTDRTYAKVDGTLTVQSWLAAVKAGRTFASNGPLITQFTVDGQQAGGELRLPATAPAEVVVDARVLSIAPIERIEVVVNGQIAQTVAASGGTAPTAGLGMHELSFRGRVAIPDGGWIAARVVGPPSPYVADSYAFAHTSPVYVVRDGRPFVSAADALYLAEVVEAIWTRADRAGWRSDADRAAFRAEIDQARAVYLKLASR
jgi:Tol biopolymer transport system component